MVIKKFLLTLVVLLTCFLLLGRSLFAQKESRLPSSSQESLEAVISGVLEEKEIEVMEKKQLYQKLELKVTKGSLKNKTIIIESGSFPLAGLQKYKIGDKVLVSWNKDYEGTDSFYITDYIRRNSLLCLFTIFVVLTALIAKWRGLFSLLGMALSFAVIFLFILPSILKGAEPVQSVVFGSLFIIPISFYLSHGFNKKTTAAVIGTIISLIITGILASIFVQFARLTGFSSEEAGFLQIYKPDIINMKGLLLAGIIISVLGVLDDIAVSQSAIVFQLKQANANLKTKELYQRAINVGQDHIASMVNTLILVYAGAALPLLLLFIDNPHPFLEIVNYEIIAEEVVRTLIGSIGLILAVPLSTFIASLMTGNK